ncbi:MAG: ACP S-malonyltransferase [Nitrospirota bacterium]
MGIAFIFPGQGSQYVGMGNNLYERFDNVKRLYDNVNGMLGFDLRKICHHGPADELNRDITAQIAVYVNNYIHLELLKDRVMGQEKEGQGSGVRGHDEGQGSRVKGQKEKNQLAPCPPCLLPPIEPFEGRLAGAGLPLAPIMVTGYSLGFYSALVAGGAIDFATGLAIVKEAAKLMEEEIGNKKGGMTAIIGLLLEDVRAICNDAKNDGDVWISNINAAKQIIVSGIDAGLRVAERLALERGALHIIPLNVGLPFHTPLMKRAGERFYEYLRTVDIKDSEIPVISYMNGQIIKGKDEIRRILAEQLYNPVMWKDTIRKMINNDIDTFIEVGPERAIYRMIQWIDRKVKVMATEDILIQPN